MLPDLKERLRAYTEAFHAEDEEIYREEMRCFKVPVK